MNTWTRDATMRYLNGNPLPADFTWPHRDGGERPVRPVHQMVEGYGKWLRETPYFPGLFELIHDILDQEAEISDAEWLAGLLRALRGRYNLKPEPGREALAHRLRPLTWTRDQSELPLPDDDPLPPPAAS